MCGIAGHLNLHGGSAGRDAVQRMTDAIRHRGPDGEGVFVDGPVALGHRRLSIIDLSPAGTQPMSTADSRYVITYNGEVYNFRELRRELEGYGHTFVSGTDTEVVLYAFVQWGERCLERFNGMFAFAIWDRHEERLFLSRDRYGIKPLYIAERNGVFLFGSEIKALLAYPGMRAEMNCEALLEYFTFQNIFTERTLFKGVTMIPAGSYQWVRTGAGLAEAPVRYWDYDFREPTETASDQEYQEELERLFVQAVRRQLVSDVGDRRLPERRYGFRRHHRHRRQAGAVYQVVHLRLRYFLGVGVGA